MADRASLLSRRPSGALPGINLDAICDAALAIEIYARHGRAGLERLEGEFALALLDGRQRALLLHRSVSGSWPLYWSAEGPAVRVGTNFVSLARGRNGAPLNLHYLARFQMSPFAFVELPGEETAFADIHRVQPGTMVWLRPGEPARAFAYWNWDERIPTDVPEDPEAAARQLLHRLGNAVAERIRQGAAAVTCPGGSRAPWSAWPIADTQKAMCPGAS